MCWWLCNEPWVNSLRALCNGCSAIGPANFAIGLFVATFVHTLLAIREVDPGDPGEPGQVPGVAVIATFVLSLASIAVLVIYVHHVGQALRISALVELAGGDTRRLLDLVPALGISCRPAAC